MLSIIEMYGERLNQFARVAWHSKPVFYFRMMSMIFYTVTVSLLFASFSYRRAEDSGVTVGIFSAFCSFAMNVPMAWFFAEKAHTAMVRLEKKELDFMIFTVFGFILSVGTTAAGLQVAIESANGFSFIKKNNLATVATMTSAFYTWSTRFVSSTYLLMSTWHGMKNTYRSRQVQYAAYYELQEDIAQYGPFIDIEFSQYLSEATNLELYAQQLYPAIHEKNIRAASHWKHIKNTALRAASAAIIMIVMINMMPLWIRLTAHGVKTLSDGLAKSGAFVLYAAASNEMFYLNSGRTLPLTLAAFFERSYANTIKKYDAYDRHKVIIGFLAAATLFLGTWSVLSYFSGEGIGEDGLKAVQQGFGSMANTLWFSWMGWWTNLFMGGYDQIATVGAGLGVNGTAFLDFCLTRVPFFKEDESAPHYKFAAVLSKYIEAGRFDELKEKGVRDVVELRRDVTQSDFSLWRCCLGKKPKKEQDLLLRYPQRNVYELT